MFFSQSIMFCTSTQINGQNIAELTNSPILVLNKLLYWFSIYSFVVFPYQKAHNVSYCLIQQKHNVGSEEQRKQYDPTFFLKANKTCHCRYIAFVCYICSTEGINDCIKSHSLVSTKKLNIFTFLALAIKQISGYHCASKINSLWSSSLLILSQGFQQGVAFLCHHIYSCIQYLTAL